MAKWITIEVDHDMHNAYQDEAIRLTRKTGKRVTLAQVVKAELARGKQRLVNKAKTCGNPVCVITEHQVEP